MHVGIWEKTIFMRILIVDDSEIVGERLKTMLSEISIVETIGLAKNQQEALELLDKLNPEVIVLDIQIPGGSSINLLGKIKIREPSPITIILTNQSYAQCRRKCMEAGADYFLDKSTEFEKIAEILDKIKNYSRGRRVTKECK
jgi:DNA-binding NarL/FixJ family response regulator